MDELLELELPKGGAFKRFGCELGSALAEETVTHGIYVLMDSVSGRLYVGQAVDIDARFKKHLKEAKKKEEGPVQVEGDIENYHAV